MITVNLARAKAQLSELLQAVQEGEIITITRHGRPAAQLAAAQPVKTTLPLEALRAFRAGMPRLERTSADLLRDLRDLER